MAVGIMTDFPAVRVRPILFQPHISVSRTMKLLSISVFREIQAALVLSIFLFANQYSYGAATGVSSISFSNSDEHFFLDQTRTITFAVSIQCSPAVTQLGLRVKSSVPTDQWDFVSCTGGYVPSVLPQAGDLGDWTFGYVRTPSTLVSFNITLRYNGTALANMAAPSYTFIATPLVGLADAVTSTGTVITASCTVRKAVFHSADTDKNLKIGLSEILKVIQICNARNDSVRTGAYLFTSNAYEPNLLAAVPTPPVLPLVPHSADISSPVSATTSNGAIEPAELTKLISLASDTVDGIRTGDYHANPAAAGFDKFVPGRK